MSSSLHRPSDTAAAVAPRPMSSIPGFDPRQVPVVGVDTQLPAIDAAQLTADALRQRFAAPHMPWQPEVSTEGRWTTRPIAKAAVLVALVQRDQLYLLLTERAHNLSNHSGQIAFPGGRQDEGDRDAADAALREAWEEVGLERSQAEVIGCLPQYETGSGFDITPVVALVTPPIHLRPNPDEVADVFEVPLTFLMNPAHHHWQQFQMQDMRRRWLSMPYLDSVAGKERFIWGATAGMLRNFYRFLSLPMPGYDGHP